MREANQSPVEGGLRPNEPGRTLRLVFVSTYFVGMAIFLGFLEILLIRRAPTIPALTLIPIGVGMILCIVVSQVASQLTFYVRFGPEEVELFSPFRRIVLPADMISAFYFAPNLRYFNIVIETKSAPRLLSDALWSRTSFFLVEAEARAWAAMRSLPALSVSGGWSRTELDRHATKLLLKCFHREYFAVLTILAGMAVLSAGVMAPFVR